MLSAGICFIAGAILTASAYHLPQLVIGRVVLGFGVGELHPSIVPYQTAAKVSLPVLLLPRESLCPLCPQRHVRSQCSNKTACAA